MSFFDIPPAAIDRGALDTFLAERLPESLNLDYKRELSDGVFETIAAMANTYGGIILLGVDEDPAEPTRPLVPPVGVDTFVRERLVNQSYTRFQRPLAPDVVPVPLEGGNVVLVIRVDPRRGDRPIVVTRGDNHKIPIRLEARNAPADRYRMAELFAEFVSGAGAASGPGNWTLGSGQHYPLEDMGHPALTARVAVETQIPHLALPGATFTVPRSLDVEEAASRPMVVRQWLTKLFLDMGLERFEDDLGGLE